MWYSRPGAWVLPSILVVGILTLAAMILKSGSIEDDLRQRALQGLSEGHPWASVKVDGRDLTISGAAPSSAARDEALIIADGVFSRHQKGTWGVRVVDATKIVPIPVNSPFPFAVKRDGDTVLLVGKVPTDELRKALGNAVTAAMPEVTLSNQLEFATGEPDEFAEKATFAIGKLKDVLRGKASLRDSTLNFFAWVATVEIAETLRREMSGTLPHGLIVGQVDIQMIDTGSILSNGAADSSPPSAPESAQAADQSIAKGETEHGTPAKAADERPVPAEPTNAGVNGAKDTAEIAPASQTAADEPAPSGENAAREDLTTRSKAQANAQTGESPVAAESRPASESALPNPGEIVHPIPQAEESQSPYTFWMIKNNTQVFLSGHAPSGEVKERITLQAQGLEFEKVDVMIKLASGAPQGFLSAVSYALHQLAHFSDGSVRISDRMIVIDGTAKTPDSYEHALRALDAPPEGFEIIAASIDPAVVSPYIWSAARNGRTITLSGFIPDLSTRDALMNALKARDDAFLLVDHMRLGDGAPQRLSLPQLALLVGDWLGHLKFGEVRLHDNIISLEGEAETPKSYETLLAAGALPLPARLEWGKFTIERALISPFVLSGERAENSLSMTGFIPQADHRKTMLDQIKRRFGRTTGNIELLVARGEPRGFNTASNNALLTLSRLTKGSFTITDNHISLEGLVPFGAPLDEIRSNFENGTPSGFTFKVALTQSPPPPESRPEECSAQILEASTANRIYFRPERATILSDSFGLLDRIAETALSCPVGRFEISGHTDSDGSEESNQRLSEARAKAVSDYLIRSGVSVERLLAVGFGEKRPIVDNETPEHKALNRRIEFRLISGN